MSFTIIKRGKARRFTQQPALRHKPSGFGKGKWHSNATFWAYKLKARRLRIISARSRRANRG